MTGHWPATGRPLSLTAISLKPLDPAALPGEHPFDQPARAGSGGLRALARAGETARPTAVQRSGRPASKVSDRTQLVWAEPNGLRSLKAASLEPEPRPQGPCFGDRGSLPSNNDNSGTALISEAVLRLSLYEPGQLGRPPSRIMEVEMWPSLPTSVNHPKAPVLGLPSQHQLPAGQLADFARKAGQRPWPTGKR